MEKKYMEEEKCMKLEKEDLESVTGGIKWGEMNGGKGPRQNYASADAHAYASAAEDEDGHAGSGRLSKYLTDYDKKTGGII